MYVLTHKYFQSYKFDFIGICGIGVTFMLFQA